MPLESATVPAAVNPGHTRATWLLKQTHCLDRSDAARMGRVRSKDESEDLPVTQKVLQPAVNGKLINKYHWSYLTIAGCQY
jgi:hypothetical protein